MLSNATNQPKSTEVTCLFSNIHVEWIGARNKQIAREQRRGSSDLFVPCSDSFPRNLEKKTLISLNKSNKYIYTRKHKGLSMRSQLIKIKIKSFVFANLQTSIMHLHRLLRHI